MISSSLEHQKELLQMRISVLCDTQLISVCKMMRVNRRNPFFCRNTMDIMDYVDEISHDITKLQSQEFQELHEFICDVLVKKYQAILFAIGRVSENNKDYFDNRKRSQNVRRSKNKEHQYYNKK